MVIWRLTELKELIKKNRGTDVLPRTNSLIDSISWKFIAAKYHRQQARCAFNEFFEDGEINTSKAMRLSFVDSEESSRFFHAKLIREANIVAAAATEHTNPEIVSQLAALLFIPEITNVHSISFKSVTQKLPDSALKEKLNEIILSPEYRYLTAFSNTIKHVSLVIPSFHISFVEPEFHGIEFKEFSFKGETYEKTKDMDFIEQLKSLSDSLAEAGALINEALR